MLRQDRLLLGLAALLPIALMACQNSATPTEALASPPPAPIKLEAEKGTLTGVTASKDGSGFSGTGYVTGFTTDQSSVAWKFGAKGGIYKVVVGFRTTSGDKGFDLKVNGASYSGHFPKSDTFAEYQAGKVELKDGENEIQVLKGWGWYDLDFVKLDYAPVPAAIKPVPATLVSPNASTEAKAVMEILAKGYGKRMLTGQYDEKDNAFIQQSTGKLPAIFGGDLMDYSPSRVEHGANPEGTAESHIAQAKKGQLVTLSWHWNAPTGLIDAMIKDDQGKEVDAKWYKGFYTNASTFDIGKTLANPESREFKLILRDIDAIAVQLKKYQAAKVPVLWRPLHEAEGKWFWWGAKGPEPCKQLYRLMFDRLTKFHKLDNLIWVWNSIDPAWYPGDDVVDIVAVDSYPSDHNDPLSNVWDQMIAQFDGKKMLALAEIGGVPDPDRMFKFGTRFAYFVSWSGSIGSGREDPARLKAAYTSPVVANSDNWRSK